jgi:sugar lactone lactonase YvrE
MIAEALYTLMRPHLSAVTELRRLQSPAITPQALTWKSDRLWMGSRDLCRIYAVDPQTWNVIKESEAPGIPWAAVATKDGIAFTIGEGENDDRYLRYYLAGSGFATRPRIACPEFTGSYLSYDGANLYLSQWYKHRILRLDSDGTILSSIDVGSEISGHTFVDGSIYVLRGTEQNGENWMIARLDPREETIVDIARVPFACRSLTFDGEHFWANHRAANEIVMFDLPG